MSKKLSYCVLGSLVWVLPLIGSDEIVQPAPQIFATEPVAQEKKASEPIVTFEKTQPPRPPFSPFTGKVNGSKVRLRAQAGLESHVVRETSTGELFAVVDLENDFYAVAPPKGTKGYVFRTYILDGVVEGERVNVRLAPDMDSPVIGKLRSGEKINATVCSSNSKWYEIDLPSTSRFYIAKEYIENIGPSELLAKIEHRRAEATHLLSSAFQFGRSEIQKPFEEIDFNSIHQKFQRLIKDYEDLSEIVEKTRDADRLLEETYVQKKIAFLESKADRVTASNDMTASHMKKIIEMGRDLKIPINETVAINETSSKTPLTTQIGEAASETIGFSAAAKTPLITEKMMTWQPLEESLYHLWAITHENHTMEEFYADESSNATILTGVVESYNRPVKNKPGDFLLKNENVPVAFLYSTKVNLHEIVGKKVTLIGAPRPNNNFAFPAYFVLSVE